MKAEPRGWYMGCGRGSHDIPILNEEAGLPLFIVSKMVS